MVVGGGEGALVLRLKRLRRKEPNRRGRRGTLTPGSHCVLACSMPSSSDKGSSPQRAQSSQRNEKGLSRRICGCHIPSRSGYQAPYPLEGGRCRRPALGPIGAAGNRGEGAAPTILCRNGSPKTIARQTREILCLPVSCDASTAANDPQFLQRTRILKLPYPEASHDTRWDTRSV